MQGIPADALAAHYAEEDEENPSKAAKVDLPTSQIAGGVIPGSLGVGYPTQPTFGSIPQFYNPRISGPPAGWQVPPRPQPWYPQHPAVSTPPPGQAGLPPQPLFPLQCIRPHVPSATTAVLQLSLSVAPPGLPATTPVPVSQPLFPVVPSNNIPPQTSMNSHSYSSGPNTGGPPIGPPPVIANKAPATLPASNEVYLVWDDEAMSMEERRLSLLKYQVHDENSQVSHFSLDIALSYSIVQVTSICCLWFSNSFIHSLLSLSHINGGISI
ncbi:hypothetical protein ACS0TY_034381 [Phlomoides rotata]